MLSYLHCLLDGDERIRMKLNFLVGIEINKILFWQVFVILFLLWTSSYFSLNFFFFYELHLILLWTSSSISSSIAPCVAMCVGWKMLHVHVSGGRYLLDITSHCVTLYKYLFVKYSVLVLYEPKSFLIILINIYE